MWSWRWNSAAGSSAGETWTNILHLRKLATKRQSHPNLTDACYWKASRWVLTESSITGVQLPLLFFFSFKTVSMPWRFLWASCVLCAPLLSRKELEEVATRPCLHLSHTTAVYSAFSRCSCCRLCCVEIHRPHSRWKTKPHAFLLHLCI